MIIMSLKGIDVSYANGSIDWKEAAKDIDFAIIRSSFGSDLPSQTDSFFHRNASECQKRGIPFGTYHFAYFVDTESAVREADFAIRLAKEYKGVRFIALDVEEDSERYAHRIGRDPDWTSCCVAFMERIKEAGYKTILYSNQDWLMNKLDFDTMSRYKLWYAAPDTSAPKYDPEIWQCSWTGKVSGITGNVDMDICYDNSLFAVNSGNDKQQTAKISYSDDPLPAKKTNSTTVEIHQLFSSQEVDKYVKVTASLGVNIRNGAGTSYSILSAIPYGTKLHVTRQTSDANYSWGLIEYLGIKGWIALNYTEAIDTKTVKKGDKVKVKNGATVYGTNTVLCDWVYEESFTVLEVSSDGKRIVIEKNGDVIAALDKKDIIKIQ